MRPAHCKAPTGVEDLAGILTIIRVGDDGRAADWSFSGGRSHWAGADGPAGARREDDRRQRPADAASCCIVIFKEYSGTVVIACGQVSMSEKSDPELHERGVTLPPGRIRRGRREAMMWIRDILRGLVFEDDVMRRGIQLE
jgi:hypothetical protein